jgi:hypothetical protein
MPIATAADLILNFFSATFGDMGTTPPSKVNSSAKFKARFLL